MTTDCDILISGGGIAGLTAAAVFGAAGFDVICVDPAPPITARDVDGSDLRTTAFLQPAQELLERCGLWERLAPHAAPLQIMRIVDAGGDLPEPRLIRDFRAADISDKPFGWNLPNWLLRREMVARLKELPNVEFRPGTATTSLFPYRHGPRWPKRRHPHHRASGGGCRRARLAHARGRRNWRAHKTLWPKGAGLCRDPPDPA